MSHQNLTKYVIFKLGKETYALDVQHAQGIITDKKIRPVPNTPKDVKGIISYQDDVFPVVDLRQKFNIESDKKEDVPFIIISKMLKDYMIGWVVDDVIEVLDSEDLLVSELHDSFIGAAGSFIEGLFRRKKKDDKESENEKEQERESELIINLNINKLFGLDEIEKFEQLQDVMDHTPKDRDL